MDERETIFKTTVYPLREQSPKISLFLNFTENHFYCNEKESYKWTSEDLFALVEVFVICKTETRQFFSYALLILRERQETLRLIVRYQTEQQYVRAPWLNF